MDIDPAAARVSGSLHADFFAWHASTDRGFDAVLGNPPFVRSHQFPEASRRLAFAGLRAPGMRPSRLMSTWAPFVALAASQVKAGGRMAFVVPEELLTIGDADELRRVLLRRFRALTIGIPPRNLFPGVQQATVLLLADDSSTCRCGLRVLAYDDFRRGRFASARPAPPWSWTGKWTHLLLSESGRNLVEELTNTLGWRKLRHYGRVEVGIVTGNNRFFLLDRRRAARIRAANLVPVVSRTHQVPGTFFGKAEFDRLEGEDLPMRILNLQCAPRELPPEEAAYASRGARKGVSSGYKCRNRSPWYAVPSVRRSDAVLFRQAGRFPRIVQLEEGCAVTDTLHRIVWRPGVSGLGIATGFLNAWTLLSAELFGRVYGGGVLELMPSEARNLPAPRRALVELGPRVDAMVRRRRFEDVIELVSGTVLGRVPAAQREELGALLLQLGARRRCR